MTRSHPVVVQQNWIGRSSGGGGGGGGGGGDAKPAPPKEEEQEEGDLTFPPPSSSPPPTEFEIVASDPLPSVDVSLTFLGLLLGRSRSNRHLVWTARHGKKLTLLFRLGGILLTLPLFLEAELGAWFAAVGVMLGTPSPLNNMGAMSFRMAQIVSRSFEFWFLTGLNLLLLALLICVFLDLRALLAISICIGIQNVLLMDANLWTRATVLRSVAMVIPSGILFAGAFMLHAVDEMKELKLVVAGREFSAIDLLANVSLTVTVLFAKNLIRGKRALISGKDMGRIPCLLYRCSLRLQPKTLIPDDRQPPPTTPPPALPLRSPLLTESPAGAAPNNGTSPSSPPTSPSRVKPRMGWRDEEALNPFSAAATERMRTAKLQLRPLLVPFVSAADVVAPAACRRLGLSPWDHPSRRTKINVRISPSSSPPMRWSVCPQLRTLLLPVTSGLFSIFCSVFVLLQEKLSEACDENGANNILERPESRLNFVMAAVGCGLSVILAVIFICRLNRRLVCWVALQFDCMFASLQAILACCCLGDIMCWDERSLAIFSFLIWFHGLLFMDALVLVTEIPTAAFRKKLAGSFIASLSVLGQLWAIHAILFSSRQDFRNRRWSFALFSDKMKLTIHMYSFTVSRLLTLLVLSARLLWKLLFRPENEFIILQGNVEYQNPFCLLGAMRPPSAAETEAKPAEGTVPVYFATFSKVTPDLSSSSRCASRKVEKSETTKT